jgi:hypothetical protein
MTEYFKLIFKSYRAGWNRRGNKKPIIEYLTEFVEEHMPGLTDQLNNTGHVKIILENLKLVLFSHMHLKNDEGLGVFIVAPVVVRDPMFNYSK